MLTLMKRLLIDYGKIYLYIIALSLILHLLSYSFADNGILSMVNSLWIMISATLSVAIFTYYLYDFVFYRHQFFYYTLKYKRSTVLVILALLFMVLNLLHYFSYADWNIWEIVQKGLSLLTYFSIVISLLYLCRTFDNKKIGFNLFIVGLIVMIAGGTFLFYNIFKDQVDTFTIGVSSLKEINHFYTTVIPITVSAMANKYQMLAKVSFGVNAILTVLFGIAYMGIRKLKINW